MLVPRLFKKVMDTLMSAVIDRYVSQLLKLARTPKQRKKAREGKGRTAKDFSTFMLEDIEKLKNFFGTYLKDTAVRAALQTAEVVAQLHGCELDCFVAECTKAAYHVDFSIHTVKQVLEAREDVTSAQNKELLKDAEYAIAMIKEALNPAAPPRAAAAEVVVAAPIAADGSMMAVPPVPVPTTPGKTVSRTTAAVTRRVQALHAFTAMQEGDLSFMPGAVIVVTDASGCWWEGYVERLGDGTIITPVGLEQRTGTFPPNFVQELESGGKTTTPSPIKDAESGTAVRIEEVELATLSFGKLLEHATQMQRKLVKHEQVNIDLLDELEIAEQERVIAVSGHPVIGD